MVIRRLMLTLVAALLLVSGTATSALAQGVPPDEITRTGGLHFVGDPLLEVGATTATATGEVAGAGRVANATLAVQWEVVRGCLNRGGNEPRGLERSFEETTGSVTFPTRQGRGTFEVTTHPVTVEPFTCPSHNMTPVLVSATAVSATLTVTSQTGTTTAFWFSL